MMITVSIMTMFVADHGADNINKVIITVFMMTILDGNSCIDNDNVGL